nr:MAG TPA: hypothetical protein [Caudoviricetes sp.]
MGINGCRFFYSRFCYNIKSRVSSFSVLFVLNLNNMH